MNLVADEGVDRAIVDALRADGFTVKYFAEAGAGSTDKEVLAAANDAQSLLLTCDKDFGELVFRQRQVHAGVVLIRLTGMPAASKAPGALNEIEVQNDSYSLSEARAVGAHAVRMPYRDKLAGGATDRHIGATARSALRRQGVIATMERIRLSAYWRQARICEG